MTWIDVDSDHTQERCATCRYWRGQEGAHISREGSQECRRNAPRPSDHSKHSLWPMTTGRNWCGDWASADQKGL